jgi:hypothetical protein
MHGEWGMDSPPMTISPVATSMTMPPSNLRSRQPSMVSDFEAAVT